MTNGITAENRKFQIEKNIIARHRKIRKKQLYALLISIESGIGAGASSLISISIIGAEDHERTNNICLHAMLLGGILSIIPAILVLFYLKPILIFVGKEMFLVMQWIIVISYFYSYLPLYSQILNHLSLEPKVMQKEQHGQCF